MVTIRTNAGEAAAEMRRLSLAYPAESQKTMIGISKALKNKIAKAVKTGAAPLNFKPLAPLTVALAKRTTFAGQIQKSIRSFARGSKLFIGWPLKLESIAKAFQSRSIHPWTKEERRRLYRRGAKREQIGQQYDRPARDVFQTYADDPATVSFIRAEYIKRIKRLLEKRVA